MKRHLTVYVFNSSIVLYCIVVSSVTQLISEIVAEAEKVIVIVASTEKVITYILKKLLLLKFIVAGKVIVAEKVIVAIKIIVAEKLMLSLLKKPLLLKIMMNSLILL